MLRPKFSILLFSVLLVSVATLVSATQKHAVRKQAVAETTVEVVPAPPPPPPLRPEQMPAVAPQVSYQNGKLTIIARNSTLGDILRAVHSKTGANIEIPGSAPERVVGQFGPGPSRDVMASLLNGSHFNYVMLGSEAHPEQLDRLILTAKAGGDAPSPSAPSQPVQAQNEPVPVQPQADAQDPNANSDDFADDSASEADATDQQAADDQGQQIGQPNAKTPEQLLLEMQRQQQIQQQQQQQQGGAPVPPQGFPPVPPGVQPRPNPPQ